MNANVRYRSLEQSPFTLSKHIKLLYVYYNRHVDELFMPSWFISNAIQWGIHKNFYVLFPTYGLHFTGGGHANDTSLIGYGHTMLTWLGATCRMSPYVT